MRRSGDAKRSAMACIFPLARSIRTSPPLLTRASPWTQPRECRAFARLTAFVNGVTHDAAAPRRTDRIERRRGCCECATAVLEAEKFSEKLLKSGVVLL